MCSAKLKKMTDYWSCVDEKKFLNKYWWKVKISKKTVRRQHVIGINRAEKSVFAYTGQAAL